MPSRRKAVRTVLRSAQTSDSADEPPSSKTPTTFTGRFFLSSKLWPRSRPLKRPRIALPTITSSVPGCAARPVDDLHRGPERERVVGHAADLHVGEAPSVPTLSSSDHHDHLGDAARADGRRRPASCRSGPG